MIQTPDTLLLAELCSGNFCMQAVTPGWRFAGDVVAGELGDRLRAISRLRAFCTIVPVEMEQCQIAVRDELDKTVVRGRISMLSADHNLATWIAVEPLRGYRAERARLIEALSAEGFERYGASDDYYPALGVARDQYTARPDIALGRDAAVYDSAAQLAGTFINIARRNEEGILADIDTEFLHDFRVSLRRVRSLLSQFRGVFDAQDSRTANNELAAIMTKTNALRDLDVHLMDRERFLALVPESMHAGLRILFDLLARERQEAYGQVCRFLQSEAYRNDMAGLQRRFGSSGGMARGDVSGETTAHYAGRMILKRYRKVAKIARTITRDTPDKTVHALRIECKKLRYLMEFFMPLYSTADIKPLVKSLKDLQDLLGRFNDCSVQRIALTRFVEDHPLRGRKGLVLAESVGALAATLYQMQLRARSDLDPALRKFAAGGTGNLFRRHFAEGVSE